MLCRGGRETYLVWGKVKWYKGKDCPIPFRKMLWDKYGKDMDDSYITDKTFIFYKESPTIKELIGGILVMS